MDALDRAFDFGLDPIAQHQAARQPQPPGPPMGLEQDENEETRTGRLGRELTGDNPIGALEQARSAGRTAREVKIAALRAARDRLSADPPNPGAALLAAASGLLSPTRTGALAESLGQGAKAAGPALQEYLRAGERRRGQDQELGIAEADVEVADADRAYQELQQRLQLGAQLTGRADNLGERRLAREDRTQARKDALEDRKLARESLNVYRQGMLAARTGAAGKPTYKVVPKVGLVKIDGDSVEVIAEAPTADPMTDPALRLKIGNMIKNAPWFKERNYRTSEEAAQAANKFIDAFIGGTLDLTTGPSAQPQSALSGAKPLKLVSEEFDLDDSVPQADPNRQNLPSSDLPPMPNKALEKGRGSEMQFTGKDLAGWSKEVAEEGAAAIATNDQIDAVRALKAPTGKLAPLKETFGQWMDAVKLDGPFRKAVNDANNITAFKSIISDQVLQKQLLQKGTQTEGDAKRLFATLAQVTNPEEANELILRYMKATNFSAGQRQRFAADWSKSVGKGSMFNEDGTSNARSAWLDYRGSLPLVGQDPNGKTIFLNEYLDSVKQANPDNPGWQKEALRRWKARFGGGVR